MYLHALANTAAGSVFCKMSTRLLSEEEEEIGIATGSASQSNIRKQRQANKRGRDGAQQQSKVRVRGLKGSWNWYDIYIPIEAPRNGRSIGKTC
jgi:hypothetical protein